MQNKRKCLYKQYFVFGMIVLLLSSCGEQMPAEVTEAYDELPELIDFNYHVKPILSDKCYHCHGPDKNSRKAELRLDLEGGAFSELREGGFAFVSGKPSKSMAIKRILSHDSSMQMPPPKSNLSLTNTEIATLIKWVEQGATWKKHWSFNPPLKSTLPENFPSEWKVGNEIDNFILAKIKLNDLKPSPLADKERLLRRVTMDLTGLPPSLEEIDAFLKDKSPDAYEKAVDRLLSSSAHAERLGMDWLDLSRYADSHGMHADGYRLMWPWRDWVISSFKRNMPYNEFVTWQLAGDLLPNPSQDQILATAFNRNHPMTDEGGVIDEEFRLKYVADRTSTTATALLGLTMECASCHDHKFDPITQKEFYQMSAFFNNIKELGMTGADGNYGPNLLMTDSLSNKKIAEIKKFIKEKELEILHKKSLAANSERRVVNVPSVKSIEGLIGYYPLESFKSSKDNTFILDDNAGSTTKAKPVMTEGKIGNAMQLTGEYDELYLYDVGLFEVYDPFSGGAWINTTKKESDKTQTIFGNTGQKNNFWRGWDLFLDGENKLNLRLVSSLPHNYFQVRSIDSIPRNSWNHVFFTYDGSGKAEGVKLFINGAKLETKTVFNKLYKTIYPITIGSHIPVKRPLAVGKSYRLHTGEFGIFKGLMDEIRIYNRELTQLEIDIVFKSGQNVSSAPAYNTEILDGYGSDISRQVKQTKTELRDLRKKLLEIVGPINEVMVMEEMADPRKTFVLERGQYDVRGEQVNAGTPEAILPFPQNLPKNRLGLAQWIFSKDNPLTSRVTVNRYWQMMFGRGLVKTANDFGNQGELPSHPELLDWLALDFIQSGWDVRNLLKKIVMSSTYQQSSVANKTLLEKDPENILLARSPSYRWPAEFVRDNALAASGLLVSEIGGASVKPSQPEELWRELSNYSRMLLHYKQDSGKSLYRRSMYTFIRRTSPPPFMTIFDTPNRDVCTVTRERTNTPLQALVLLNDPQFVEASKALAERMMQFGGVQAQDKITFGFRLSTGRTPTKNEVEVLNKLYVSQKDFFTKNSKGAEQLLSVGDYRMAGKIDKTNLSAMTIVANTILNHDEAYTKR